jgi:hypothetical protein
LALVPEWEWGLKVPVLVEKLYHSAGIGAPPDGRI